jgi:hypothetical protein
MINSFYTSLIYTFAQPDLGHPFCKKNKPDDKNAKLAAFSRLILII